MIAEKLILALFYQIMYMSIIATVIGLVIFGIRKLIVNKISPKYRYIIWGAFMLALVFPVAIPNRISIYNYIDISEIKDKGVTFVATDLNVNNYKDYPKIYEDRIKEDTSKHFIKVIAYIWFAICVAKLIQIIISSQILNTKIGDYEIRDERMIKILEKCKKKLKINKKIKIIKQDFVKTPAVVGIFRVRILFTERGLKLDDIFITDIIMHELSHYKRKDAIFNIFAMIMKSIYWFNPVIRMIFKYVKKDMEFATDQMALNHLEEEEKDQYCRAILKVVQMRNFEEETVVLGMASYVKDLEERIDMIALVEEFEKHTKRIACLSSVIILFIWLLLYPTSYGMFGTPKLYLQSENGDKVEATLVEEEGFPRNTIIVEPNDKLKLLMDNRKNKDYMVCEVVPLKSKNSEETTKRMLKDVISGLDAGEYIYKFTLERKNNKTISYEIKVVVK